MTSPPKIKKSRRGLLHRKLGIPEGERIGTARLEQAKRSQDPSIRSEAQFALNVNAKGTHGKVVGVSAHRDGKSVTVRVRHGRKSPMKKGESPVFDERPESEVVLPMAQARRYHVGQRVGVGAAPLDGDHDPSSEPDDDGDENPLVAYNRTVRGIMTGKRQKRRKS